MKCKPFIQQFLDGEREFDEIDNAIDEWHQSNQPIQIYEWLGLTVAEYSEWIMNPDGIYRIYEDVKQKRRLKNES